MLSRGLRPQRELGAQRAGDGVGMVGRGGSGRRARVVHLNMPLSGQCGSRRSAYAEGTGASGPRSFKKHTHSS